ncbi:MAG: ketoacyl-ACP synthase III, partial [Phascolarctobacterium sp.]|nr:ketoacyl-ACP synthase III [Phascolarctobacterium sp.]
MKAYVTKIEYILPERIEENPKNRLTKKTGIFKRHICSENEIASDLAFKAAEKLFKTGIDKDKIDYLILCTQSPDYYLPTTACILQDRLALPKSCGAFDYNLGCSGYIYGLSIAKGLIESDQAENVLLITAETYSKYINPKDNTVLPLFGDAATATLITGIDTEKSGLNGFVLGTDGSGCNKLIVPVGGMKNRVNVTKIQETIDDFGNTRTNYDLYMDGSAISDFALEVVPDTLEKVLVKTNLIKGDIDYFVFHQANKFMLEFLQMKCDLLGY